MNNKISIPKPCHENWDQMLPEEQGRHCLSCCKTVIDFSTWDNESILTYLQNRNNERVCGRFNTEQVEPGLLQETGLAKQVIRSGMPLLRKIAALIVLCFGLSNLNEAQAQKMMGKVAGPRQPVEHTKGEIAVQPAADTTKAAPVTVDTIKMKPQIMGMIAPYHPTKNKPAQPAKVTKPKAKKTISKEP